MMQNATLIVSQSGLERLVLGTRLRRLDWRDVRRIRQFVLYSRPSAPAVTQNPPPMSGSNSSTLMP
jgi:hypothetical protein